MDYKINLYIMMEANYLKENGRNIGENNTDLFPDNWYLFDDYILKTDILYEAIMSKKQIIDTEKYKLMLEKINISKNTYNDFN